MRKKSLIISLISIIFINCIFISNASDNGLSDVRKNFMNNIEKAIISLKEGNTDYTFVSAIDGTDVTDYVLSNNQQAILNKDYTLIADFLDDNQYAVFHHIKKNMPRVCIGEGCSDGSITKTKFEEKSISFKNPYYEEYNNAVVYHKATVTLKVDYVTSYDGTFVQWIPSTARLISETNSNSIYDSLQLNSISFEANDNTKTFTARYDLYSVREMTDEGNGYFFKRYYINKFSIVAAV